MNHSTHAVCVDRRRALALAAGALAVTVLRPAAAVSAPAVAGDAETIDEAIKRFAGDAKIARGRVKLDIPPLVENGNSAPVDVRVESPMTPQDHVKRIAIFNERNPQPNVLTCQIGPRAGRAQVSTRMRLANTQNITAVAEMSDGTYWSDSANVIVTLAACTEELP